MVDPYSTRSMKKIYHIIVVLAFGLCACNKEESIKEAPKEAPVVYHISIPASFDVQAKSVTFNPDGSSISTQFETTDKIYVYNETKGAFARSADGEHLLSYLQPSTSGSSCTLEGDLAFYKNNGDAWNIVEVEASDTYSLYYQMNEPNSSFVDNTPRFNYSIQTGSAASASLLDFAEATGVTMSLSGSTLTAPDDVHFDNMQSMFRQRLSFRKEGGLVTPTVTRLKIDTKNGTLLTYYRPTDTSEGTRYQEFSISIDNPDITNDGDIYLSLAFHYSVGHPATGDQLILTAYDDSGNRYQCSKNIPNGGFGKSKYYYGSMVLDYVEAIKPTVTRSNGSELEPDPDVFSGELWYDIYKVSGDDHIEITIDGDSEDYRFYLNNDPAIVTLTGHGNPVSASWTGHNAFIESDDDLTIILDCDYFIDNSADYEKAIECGGNLKLKTTGKVQTLTVITNSDDPYGIYGVSNWDAWMVDFSEIDNLSDEGFTVTCPEPVNNGDGTFTWKYTVTPDYVGKIMGADGVVYADTDAAAAAGTTAEAMIAYAGRIDGVCENGLAISLTDAYEYNATYAEATGAAIIPSWEAYHAVAGGTWRLPSEKDWQYMMWGYYTDSPVAAPVGTVKSALTGGYYWTSTGIDGDNAKGIYYDGTSNASIQSLAKTGTWHVRACLSF